jgi:hypothetical protein
MRRPRDKTVTNKILDEDTVPGEQFIRQPLAKYEKIQKKSERFLRGQSKVIYMVFCFRAISRKNLTTQNSRRQGQIRKLGLTVKKFYIVFLVKYSSKAFK